MLILENLYNPLNFVLLILCLILGASFHRASTKHIISRFSNIDFLCACLMYLFSFSRLWVILDLDSLTFLTMGIEIYVCIRLITVFAKEVPEVYECVVPPSMVDIPVPRTYEQIYTEIQKERLQSS